MSTLHIAIVGAGLGGLALGQALKRANIAFTIYEYDLALDARSQGYRIRIDAEGQRALAHTLPPELYQLFRHSASVSSTPGSFLTPLLTPAFGRVPESWYDNTDDTATLDADLSINRRTLREILMCGIEEHIHFGYGVDHYHVQDDGRVALHFNRHNTPAYCDVVVGADGVNSTIRTQLAPDAIPSDTGTLCIYGKTDVTTADNGAAALHGTTIIFANGFTAILDEMRFAKNLSTLAANTSPACLLSPVDDYLYWAIIGPRSTLDIPTTHDAAPTIHHRLATLSTDWHPALQQMLQSSDAASIASLPIRNGRPDVVWPTGPVTLLGDAIHAMSPAGGLGANTALRDALALANALIAVQRGEQELSAALISYETAMRDWASAAIANSDRGAAKLFETVATTQHA